MLLLKPSVRMVKTETWVGVFVNTVDDYQNMYQRSSVSMIKSTPHLPSALHADHYIPFREGGRQ